MSSPSIDRRTVIRSAGVLGVGVAGASALAACSSDSGGTADAGAGGAASAAGVTAKVADVPVGGGKIFPEQLVVVTQPTAGEFKAFSATCTHMQCAVTSVADGKIICPCHGSHFDITTGEPTAESQAKKPLPAKTATVSGDTVTVA